MACGSGVLFLFLPALILALACPQALALGISPLYSNVLFIPGGEVRGSFTVINTEGFENVLVTAESDMDIVFKEKTVRLAGKDGVVDFTFELPKGSTAPGDHEVKIFVQPDLGASTSGVSARVRLAHKLTVRVPYEGPYVVAAVEVRRTAAGEIVLQADLENLGSKATPITALFIMTPEGTTEQLLNASFGPETIDAGEKAQVNVTLPATRIPLGRYGVDLFVRYADRVINTSTAYVTGEPRFALTHTPRIIRANELADFPVAVHSQWNQPIQGLYAEIVLMEGKDTLRLFRTESVDVPALGDAVLPGVFDARGITPRNATLLVRLHFGQTQEFNVPVDLVDARDYEWLMTGAEKQGAAKEANVSVTPVVQEAVTQKDSQSLLFISIFILAVFVLVIIVGRRIKRGETP